MTGPDLHIHSTFSDGLLTPEEIVGRAISLGLPAIAIADHDSVGGVGPALDAADGTGLTVIPAVELSADDHGRSVHLLGYHIDHTDRTLLERLASLRRERIARARRIIDALSSDGIDIRSDALLPDHDRAAIGRAHIARALIASGHARDMSDAFDRFVGDRAPYFAAKTPVTPERAIGWIAEAGGVAVLAHPGLSAVDDRIDSLISAGLAGIEACHASHDSATTERYRALADKLGLIATGGSDFHGSEREGGDIGSSTAPENALLGLEAAAARVRGSL